MELQSSQYNRSPAMVAISELQPQCGKKKSIEEVTMTSLMKIRQVVFKS